MNSSSVPLLTPRDLVEIGRRGAAAPACTNCGELVCPGWESTPSSFDRARLQRIGMLRQGGDEEATLREHHPRGTHIWSPDAPIAPAFFPYNRCDVWQCGRCGRAFLLYTEYGGYYEDERIRALDSDLVDDDAWRPLGLRSPASSTL